MPIPGADQIRSGAGETRQIALPVINAPRSGPARPHPGAHRMARRRTWLMALIYILIVAHVLQWWLTGRTLGPFVASDTMETLENGVVNGGFLIFAAVLLLTLVAGRFLCGWGCHMGGLQDLSAWLLRKAKIRPRLFHSRLLALAPIALGLYMFVWPTFLREALVPALRMWWPAALPYVGVWHDFPGWSARLSTTDMWERLPGIGVAIPFLLSCGFATVYFLGARGFCRVCCPYGGIMSPLEQLSPARIKADLTTCDRCGVCTAACTSGVRVMEEVHAYGRVVSRHCTRTLDCVAACPSGSLALRWTRPAVFKGTPASAIPRVIHDLSWPEELLVAGAFSVCFLAVRSLYDLIPMLMAVAIAGCFAFLIWKAWRVLRDRDSVFAGLQLRRAGRWSPAGAALLGVAAMAVALVAHSVAVRLVIWRAGQLENSVTISREIVMSGQRELVPAEMQGVAERSLRLYAAAAGWRHGGWALTDTPTADLRAAWLHLVRSEYGTAEDLLRRASGRLKESDTLASDLGRVMLLRGQSEGAVEHLESVLARHPGFGRTCELLCSMYVTAGRTDRAIEILERAVAEYPLEAVPRAQLASLYVALGRPQEAMDHLLRAAAAAPGNLSIVHDLAVVRFMMGDVDGAASDLERAAMDNPAAAAELLRRASEMMFQAGRPEDGRAWLERATAAEGRGGQDAPRVMGTSGRMP